MISITFPISRDPPEGGTLYRCIKDYIRDMEFPISRDPPEGGTNCPPELEGAEIECFQFLGIPPKGEQSRLLLDDSSHQ